MRRLAESKQVWIAQHRKRQQAASAEKSKPPSARAAKAGASGKDGAGSGKEGKAARPRGASLLDLIAAGVVKPGEGNAFLTYRDQARGAAHTARRAAPRHAKKRFCQAAASLCQRSRCAARCPGCSRVALHLTRHPADVCGVTRG